MSLSKETQDQIRKEAEELLESQEVKYWDWLRCKGTTPTVYAAIIKAMNQYAEQEAAVWKEKAEGLAKALEALAEQYKMTISNDLEEIGLHFDEGEFPTYKAAIKELEQFK